MSDPVRSQATIKTKVDKRRRVSLIWAIPVVTVLIGGWLIWDTYSKRGPTVTVTFQAGEGLLANQSHVRHLDVDLGVVKSVVLAPDYSHVIVTLEMKPEATAALNDKARFWVVKPRLFAGNLSGLDTLVSGSYVELLPSNQSGASQRRFVGLEDPPVLQTQEAGQTFLLKAEQIGSVSVGSPIFFRNVSVGQVLGWDLADDANSVTIHAFVRAPFDKFIVAPTRFWDASGISLTLGAGGVRLQLESVKALLLGGIAFETPKDAPAAAPIEDGHSFKLFASREDADNSGFLRHVQFVSYFPGAVSGLQSGSLVTFQGLRVGQVLDVGLEYDHESDSIRVPVHYEVEPERLANIQVVAGRGPLENTRILVQRGLRAELQSANLLTGQMRVALQIDPDAAPAELGQEGNVLVMPTVSGGFAGIQAAASQLLSKLSRMPLEQIGKNLNDTLKGVSDKVNGPELADALVKLQETLGNAQEVVKHVDAGLSPVMARLPAVAADLQSSVTKTGQLVGSANDAYGMNSKFNRDIGSLLGQLNDTARSLRALADLLTRHPEALVRGRTNQGPE
jgi:paraquat-inducible protein B